MPRASRKYEIQTMFYALEGLAGTGKSTQARILAHRIAKAFGRGVIVSAAYEGERRAAAARFINSSGMKLDERALMFLFQSLHCVQYSETVKALNAGHVVIADRWRHSFYSHHAYFDTFGGDTVAMDVLDRLAYGDLEPDLTLFLQADPSVALARYLKREARIADGAIELRSADYFTQVDKFYRQLARERGWAIIDANQSVRSVARAVFSCVEALSLK